MTSILRLLLIACLTLVPALAVAGGHDEIEALLDRVAAARGVTFIRNGTAHDGPEAAAHLRRKLVAARGRIRTPEQLIEHLGTRSSLTGRPYRVRLANGREIDSAVWLHGLLREVRVAQARTGPAPVPRGAR
jgi:hypothetical protein